MHEETIDVTFKRVVLAYMSVTSLLLTGVFLWALLALPPIRSWLESTMVGHVLVQIPLLGVVGLLLGTGVPNQWNARIQSFNAHGIPGMLVVLFAIAFWMLPRSLDGALGSVTMAIAKFTSLPLLVGVPLALSWPKLSSITKGFVLVNVLAMAAVLGWLYMESPVRLCNNYLAAEQLLLGKSLLWLTGGVCLYWIVRLFAGTRAQR